MPVLLLAVCSRRYWKAGWKQARTTRAENACSTRLIRIYRSVACTRRGKKQSAIESIARRRLSGLYSPPVGRAGAGAAPGGLKMRARSPPPAGRWAGWRRLSAPALLSSALHWQLSVLRSTLTLKGVLVRAGASSLELVALRRSAASTRPALAVDGGILRRPPCLQKRYMVESAPDELLWGHVRSRSIGLGLCQWGLESTPLL